MGSHDGRTPRDASMRNAAAAGFIGFFLAAVIWRVVAHLAGWQEHGGGETLLYAVFMGCVGALFGTVSARGRTR